MTWPYRPRPGVGDDIVYERKSAWFWIFPHWLDIGWKAYANVASARNRRAKNLNKLTDKLLKELDEWAKAEALVQEEGAFIKARRFNHLGVGEVDYMTKKEIGEMYPYCGEEPPRFRKVIYQHVINKALSDNGARIGSEEKGSKRLPDMMVTSVEGAEEGSSLHARHVVAYKAQEKKNSKGNKSQNKQSNNGNNGNKGKKSNKLGTLKGVFPKDQDESNEEWEERLQDILDQET